MTCETNPCKRFTEMRDRSERRGDELYQTKKTIFGYVNDWRTGALSSNEAMISIATACDAMARWQDKPTQ